ncbi:MAG: RES family NAD+ phosphorylase, partial [Saprospiraceae bacterium]|nr:RES family NAD+ phosphorylase [Saprospiraceae bacterium]
GRWNHQGIPVLYTSSHISLAFLELLVNVDSFQLYGSFQIVGIQIPEEVTIKYMAESKMPKNWRSNENMRPLRDLGTTWQKQSKFLVLAVPSAVIPFEFNFLINPGHDNFKKIKIKTSSALEIDQRFLLPE